MKRLVRAAAVTASIVAGGSAAEACGTGELLFSDTFDTMTKTWGQPDEFMKVEGGQLVINEKDGNFYVATSGPTYRDVDFCATFKPTDSSDPASSYAGVTFWGQDVDHFYTFQMTVDGYATVYQYTGEWKSIIDDTAVSSIKQGVGAENELRVVTKGDTATLYINGERFNSITGVLPNEGQHLGFTVEAPEKGKVTFAIDNAEVRTPAANADNSGGGQDKGPASQGGSGGANQGGDGSGPSIKPGGSSGPQ
jgi:hypothetical protein